MNTAKLWNSLRARMGAGGAARHVAIQHLALPEDTVQLVQAALEQLGPQLGLQFELRRVAGEIVIMDAARAQAMTPQLMHSLAEERPVLTVQADPSQPDLVLSAAERFERCQQELLSQLQDIALVRRRSPHWSARGWALQMAEEPPATEPAQASAGAFDPGFDSVLDAAQLLASEASRGQAELLNAVRRGMNDPSQRALDASYGPEANLRFDFRARLVTIDPLALQHLRVRCEVPQPGPSARPQTNHSVLELDEVVWALGLAAGGFTLVDEPQDWWHTPLACASEMRLENYSRLPLHLELMRQLRDAPCSPSHLRRAAHCSVSDVRRFVQATLLLRLLRWAGTDAAAIDMLPAGSPVTKFLKPPVSDARF